MVRYYCDYCDAFLTHDSPAVRKQHNTGYKHKSNVKAYYLLVRLVVSFCTLLYMGRVYVQHEGVLPAGGSIKGGAVANRLLRAGFASWRLQRCCERAGVSRRCLEHQQR